ncbi:acetylornithine aminotransferase apoenzyme [Clostridium sp. USBA 49]|uniref:aspartate aminotransferase family protein n=1 Tax=Clostridium sp. USBA 49 TaxID=1881060 RepID=UPI00099ABF3E|nr:aspartate aminotransferase family protein [Clostridium sp. USBA 49]SKA86536.1 acetylornithine aminotransferase apoenzyme [Clostridium sp. USBA 49]
MSKNSLMNTYERFDVIFEKGIGSRLYDVNGKEYIDFVSGVAVNCLGHSHPAIINAITEQSKKVIHISNYYWNTKHIELANKLIENCDHSKVFFCNSGTEAVEGALKAARKYGKLKGKEDKNIILYMTNSFHGRSMGALSVTGQSKYQKNFMPLIGGVKEVEFNNIEDLKRNFNENVCGVIIEPIQGEGGIIEASSEFLKEVREQCDKYDALLIFDEIQCGMGRLGSLFAYKKFGVIPDIITIAKALGGGFPIGAFIVNEKAEGTLVPGDHGSTFGGNPLACSVGCAILNELVDGGVIESVEEKSKYLKEKLLTLQNKYGVIKEIRGTGLLIGIKVDDPKSFMKTCFSKGLLVITAGKDIIRLLPPLNVEKEDMDAALNILEGIMQELSA